MKTLECPGRKLLIKNEGRYRELKISRFQATEERVEELKYELKRMQWDVPGHNVNRKKSN